MHFIRGENGLNHSINLITALAARTFRELRHPVGNVGPMGGICLRQPGHGAVELLFPGRQIRRQGLGIEQHRGEDDRTTNALAIPLAKPLDPPSTCPTTCQVEGGIVPCQVEQHLPCHLASGADACQVACQVQLHLACGNSPPSGAASGGWV